MNLWKGLALAFVFCWFFFGGLAHFLYDDFFVGIVPPGIKAPETLVYVSGIFEILGALALLSPVTRRLAGWGLFLLTLCVTPANLYMWMRPDLFAQYPESLLGLRLVIQVFLLALILWSTENTEPVRSARPA
jgi:uncharacterized membrane protein